MKNETNIKKNYIYNLLYQVLLIIVPLISTPYLSRVLGEEKTGIFSYTLSIATYFILLGGLGINLYGQKEIAYSQKKETERSKKFVEIFILKAIFLFFSIFVYALIFYNNNYGIYYKILTIEIISNIIDITWYFQGLEDFKKTVIRNSIVKICSLIAIFCFVKSKEDLPIYFIIYTVSNLIGNLSLWLYLPKCINIKKIKNVDVFKHLLPTISLFIPQIAIQIYTVLDKTMLGKLADNIGEVGYYEYGQRIVNVLLIVVTSLGTVMLPRISNLYAENNIKKMKEYIQASFKYVITIALPIVFGVLATANIFVPLFLGSNYHKSIYVVSVLVFIVLFIGFTNIIGCQYLLPCKKNKEYTISVIVGAVINFTLNMILIPRYQCIGAAIATALAEFSVLIAQILLLNKELDFKPVIKYFIKTLLFTLIMFVPILLVSYIIKNIYICLITQVLLGVLIYLGLLILDKNELVSIILKKENKNEKK